MDLLSTVRKTGSRGGVNFSWDEVANSSHRENYLGHSLKAPVGRWQKGRDLNWYAKAEGSDTPNESGETDAERIERERKEEIRRIKEAEEDAMAQAMGLPPPVRDASGANSVDVAEKRRIGPSGPPPPREEDESHRRGRSRRHGDSDRREKRRHRSRSRSRGDREGRHRRHHDHGRHRDRSRERPSGGRDERRPRRERSTSRERREGRETYRRDRSRGRYRSRSREGRRRSISPRHRR